VDGENWFYFVLGPTCAYHIVEGACRAQVGWGYAYDIVEGVPPSWEGQREREGGGGHVQCRFVGMCVDGRGVCV
jgi:hypothetical protein